MNLLAAKAKKTVLNVSPAGCGMTAPDENLLSISTHHNPRHRHAESAATDTIKAMLRGRAVKYTSLTLAGLKHVSKTWTESDAHVIIDDMGAEKSDWSRTSTITVLASLVHTHYILKITQGYRLEITGFYGSAALNVQPVLFQSLCAGSDWIAVVRDKVLRYYHLIRPVKPKGYLPTPETVRIDYLLKSPCSGTRQPSEERSFTLTAGFVLGSTN